MLNFILGLPRSGKSAEIQNRAAAIAAAGGSAVLVVPEQCAFFYETEYLASLGAEHAHRIKIFSFRTLCRHIFARLGGAAGDYATDVSKLVTLKLALGQLEGRLEVYRRQVKYTAFLQKLLEFFGTLKNAGISPEAFEEALPAIASAKARELSEIYSVYNALLLQSYRDNLDDCSRAAKKLEGTGIFEGCEVFFDEFASFSASQLDLLKVLLSQTNVTVALTFSDEDERFFVAQQTRRELLRLDGEAGETRLSSPPRLPQEIAFLAENAFGFSDEKLPKNERARAFFCENEYREAEAAICEIERLVRSGGYRYRDFCLLAADFEGYQQLVKNAARRLGVPIFADGRVPAKNHPLVRFAKAILALCASFSPENLLAALKTEVTGFSLDEICVFEDYVYTWSIKSNGLKKPFSSNPSGFSSELSAADEEALAAAERVREAFYSAVSELRKSKNAAEFCAGFLGVFGVLGCETSSDENKTVFEIIEEIGQKVSESCKKITDKAGIYSLISALLDTADFGIIPQTADCVIFGKIGRTKPQNPRVAVLLGLVDGEFPKTPSDSGLLRERERAQLKAAGLELNEASDKFLCQNAVFVALNALCAASERIYLFAPTHAAAGKERLPSSVFELFEEVEAPHTPPVFTREGAFAYFAENHARGDGEMGALREIFADDPRLGVIAAGGQARAGALADTRVLGESLALTQSRLTKFASCPFAYFCEYTLGIKPRAKAELDNAATGTLIHDVIEQLTRDWKRFYWLPEAALAREVREKTAELFALKLGGAEANAARVLYLLRRLEKSIFHLCLRLQNEFSLSRFRPVAFEKKITAQVGEIELRGTIDRVDMAEVEGRKYIRVVDYKSGNKTFDWSEVYYGEQLQLPLYLSALLKGEYADALPAGVLYCPTGKGADVFSKKLCEREISDERLADCALEEFRQKGVLLGETAVLDAMEEIEPGERGKHIPVRYKKADKKTGEVALDAATAANTLSAEEFSQLFAATERIISELGAELKSGHIAAAPLKLGEKSPCGFCDYGAVCAGERAERTAKKRTKDEVLGL